MSDICSCGEHWHDDSETTPVGSDVTPSSTGGVADWKGVALLVTPEFVETTPRIWTHRFSIAHTTMLAAIRATPTDVVTPTIVNMFDEGDLLPRICNDKKQHTIVRFLNRTRDRQ
jgi:hypothetical protein